MDYGVIKESNIKIGCYFWKYKYIRYEPNEEQVTVIEVPDKLCYNTNLPRLTIVEFKKLSLREMKLVIKTYIKGFECGKLKGISEQQQKLKELIG